MLGPAAQHHRIEIFQQDVGRCIYTDVLVHAKLHAFRLHLRHAQIDVVLFHLEVGNAVTQQAANTIAFFKHDDLVSGAAQLLCAGQPCGTGSDDGDAFAGFTLGRLRYNPTHLPALVDDGVFDGLDSHRIVVDIERARRFARRRTNAPGELRKVVCRAPLSSSDDKQDRSSPE